MHQARLSTRRSWTFHEDARHARLYQSSHWPRPRELGALLGSHRRRFPSALSTARSKCGMGSFLVCVDYFWQRDLKLWSAPLLLIQSTDNDDVNICPAR